MHSDSGLYTTTAVCTSTHNTGWRNIVRHLLMPHRLCISDKDSERFRLTFFYFVLSFFIRFLDLSSKLITPHYMLQPARRSSGKRSFLDIYTWYYTLWLSNFEFFVLCLTRLKITFVRRSEPRSVRVPVSNQGRPKNNFFFWGERNFEKVLFV